ncbi:2OG-Fe(II) oxygenase [Ramlibacter sp. 2FC]|uniref:2OG-Fe(II) oxygenase n=1 Tax=Ramlibacter sp. 2FC TaxID=2502188 RepID=UPI001485A082|nr:2OG-Fe(II) oxygenase [Ramlibacter sp. 2FC]
MTDDDFPYSRSLAPLESLLAGVKRPGDFCVHGALALPMPMIQVDGVGMLSFPLPQAQIAALVDAAERAPYGRGERTVVDTSVRRVWQIDAARVRISGKSWAQSLGRILAETGRGLGCEDAAIRAELYKLLVYDPGGFFLAHRDGEKAPGMFGTLLLQLPSPHAGGELRIRHGSRETRIDLSATDFSELGFAAFYADCEHEVRPVESGHRVCLVFNLVRGAARKTPPARAPSYEAEVAQAARLIGAAFAAEGAPCKLAWLLAHQYSQAELGFGALKGVDAAVAGVLCRAADAAACCAHLGVVHIEESGPAQVNYAPSRGRGYHDDFDDEIDAAGVDYEVVEISDTARYIDHWVAAGDQRPALGRLPLGHGELLPAGALDDEPPDEDRLLESTGNEGVSFERAYRRAALILWPRARQVEVLLQAGVDAALPLLEEVLAAEGVSAGAPALDLAERIVAHWSRQSTPRYAAGREGPLRVRMLRCLARLGTTAPGERFLREVVVADYDGSENAALAEAAPAMLAAQPLQELFAALVESSFLRCPRALCELLFLLEAGHQAQPSPVGASALRRFTGALVDALPGLAARPARSDLGWALQYDETAADAASCHRLLGVLERLASGEQHAAAVTTLIAHPKVFDPGRILVPALQVLCAAEEHGGIERDAQRLRLWVQCCTFLLARSEMPPAAPRDWSQPAELACRCEDCQALQVFALHPQLREQRFRVRQDRREHLQRQIAQHGLDMNHVTDRRGSPQTLVCCKTRESYRRQCRQHTEDIAAMRALEALAVAAPDAQERTRLAAAVARQPQAVEG